MIKYRIKLFYIYINLDVNITKLSNKNFNYNTYFIRYTNLD